MNLASVIVEADLRGNGHAPVDDRARRCLLIKAVLENADLYKIPLQGAFLESIETILPTG
jgi:hypothetical protein